MKETIRITHRPTGTVLAEGPLGWGITPFEGNYYIGRKHRRAGIFKPNFVPGLCFYKFLYVWMDLTVPGPDRTEAETKAATDPALGWMYWLPNPLFPFIWFRIALPGTHPHLLIERLPPAPAVSEFQT